MHAIRTVLRETFRSRRLSLVPVDGDQISKELRRGDFVLAAPCNGFQYDGLYVLDMDGIPLVYRAMSRPGQITLLHDRGGAQDVPHEWFDQHVLGIVVCDLKVRDAGLLRQAWESGR